MNTNEPTLTIQEWINIGIKNKWCSDIFCYNHDGIPMTDDEYKQESEVEYDQCWPIVRIYD